MDLELPTHQADPEKSPNKPVNNTINLTIGSILEMTVWIKQGVQCYHSKQLTVQAADLFHALDAIGTEVSNLTIWST